MNIPSLPVEVSHDYNGNMILNVFAPTLGNKHSDTKSIAIIHEFHANMPYDVRVIFTGIKTK